MSASLPKGSEASPNPVKLNMIRLWTRPWYSTSAMVSAKELLSA